MTAAGQTYEEIAQLVAEQVGGGSVIFRSLLEGLLLKKKKKMVSSCSSTFPAYGQFLHPSSKTNL